MKNRVPTFIIGILFQSIFTVNAQVSVAGGGPYTLITSEPFDVPGKQLPHNTLGYGKNGMIQVNSKGAEVISFQKFSTGLTLEKENSIDIQDKITGHVYYDRAVALKNKSYVFLRDVKKELGVEGITAFEFSTDKLELSKAPVSLFQSSRRISEVDDNMYQFVVSKDKSKFLYSYKARPIDSENRLTGKEIFGIYAFDENLEKLWGGEYEMPYGVKGMIVGDIKLADNGNAYLLIKVIDCNECLDIAGNYHFEVLIFQKDQKSFKQVEVNRKEHVMVEAFLDESPSHEMNVIISYIQPVPANVEVRNTITGICLGKLNGDKYVGSMEYEIPTDVVKLYTDEKTLKDMAYDEAKGLKPGIENLKIRSVYYTPNGSTKIITEVYSIRTYYVQGTPYYSIHGGDLVIFSLDTNFKLEWMKKIRKSQDSGDQFGNPVSINVICKGDNLHLFFLDHIPNESETPSGDFKAGNERYLKGVSVDVKGNVNRYSLGKISMKSNNFYVRKFGDGGNDNLIENSRESKKNKLFSIQVN